MVHAQQWTFVLSEYLDLPFLLRRAGVPVISARSVREALEILQNWRPARVVVDTTCFGADTVFDYVQDRYPEAELDLQEWVVQRLLAN